MQAAFHITCCIAWLGKISSSLLVLHWPGCRPVLAGVLRYFFSASWGVWWLGGLKDTVFVFILKENLLLRWFLQFGMTRTNPPCRRRDIHICFIFVVVEQRVPAVFCFDFFS